MSSHALRFAPRVERLDSKLANLDVPRALDSLRELDGLALLDSVAPRSEASNRAAHSRRFSLLAFEPQPLDSADSASIAGVVRAAAAIERHGAAPGPFQAGFIGALAYDLGVAGEQLELPRDPLGLPSIVGGLYFDFLLFDHRADTVHLVLGRGADSVDRERVLDLLASEAPRAAPKLMVDAPTRRVSAAEHRARVEQVRAQIAAGECYQANLAHRFSANATGDPVDLYLRLRRSNPAPYAGFLRFDGGALLSSSPELLLDYDGERALTRPIKGTAPRDADPQRDAQCAEALLASAKDRAELAMIVDMARNDLGRVAELGSVAVERFPELESFEAVHHLVASVSATVRGPNATRDLLESVFPGASITGAPKLASMRAIAELEREGRGFFTGSLGFCDARGAALFNILIRTIIWRDAAQRGNSAAELALHVGGGITWGSDPQAEDDETLDKARALLAALE